MRGTAEALSGRLEPFQALGARSLLLLIIQLVLALAAGTPVPAFPGVATSGAALPTPIPFSPPPIGPQSFAPPSLADSHPTFVLAIQLLFMIATIGLIALMSVQTTKTEGLSGSIGGRAEAAYKGRLGFDQQITRVTTIFAVTWIALAVVFFVVAR
jgi:preprotein translocase subunit SecG